MATSPQVAFRLSDEADAERFAQLCRDQDRGRSDMARRVFRAGLDALAGPPPPAELPTPDPAPAAGDDPADHEFEPQPRNALKCRCGRPKRDHRRPKVASSGRSR